MTETMRKKEKKYVLSYKTIKPRTIVPSLLTKEIERPGNVANSNVVNNHNVQHSEMSTNKIP